jgi:type IV pilus assembly protein PilB
LNNQFTISLNTELQQVINSELAWHYGIIPLRAEEKNLAFYASSRLTSNAAKEELEVLFGKVVELVDCPEEQIQKALATFYRKNTTLEERKVKTVDSRKADDFLSNLIGEAKQLGSSDIHIEAFEERCRVRVRIDGHLIERYIINRQDYPSLVNKIKIKANLDIAEKRLPQDGRIFFENEGSKFDIRVSVLPTLHGEKIVLRLLNKDAANIDIHHLGFTAEELKNYFEGIRKPHGIVLISGPTGSGKTTTLYATLKILNKEKTNILTIEDPVEYTLEGINQVQLKDSIGLNFAAALRTFLRQDPDVIMVGEIRDAETAQIAIRAALTGHLVLSTIHTNSAWGTVSRLTDMGVPPYLLAGTLNTSVAQRLVRLLCNSCKEEQDFKPEFFPLNYRPARPLHKHRVAKGCEACHYTGYKGRKAIYEVISIDHELADNIRLNMQDASVLLKEKNVKTLSENAFELLEEGATSIEEVYPILLNNY